MHSEPEFTADLTGFEGTVPLFPLDGVVLFPHVALPLHIFEPRYRKMVADALDGNRLIALALPRSGPVSPAGPELNPIVCVGRITAEERLAGGRYNIVLTGLQRAELVSELVTDLPYRVRELELLPDEYRDDLAIDLEVRQEELLKSFRRLMKTGRSDSLFQQMLDADLPLGVLCDLLVAALKVAPVDKYRALAEVDVERRSEFLLRTIHALSSEGQPQRRPVKYPPRFSLN